jgi:hypothetical protein
MSRRITGLSTLTGLIGWPRGITAIIWMGPPSNGLLPRFIVRLALGA